MTTNSSTAVSLAALACIAGAASAWAAPASQLTITSAPQALTAGRCSGVLTFQTRDAFGGAAPVSALTQVNLDSTSPTTVFYLNSSCTSAITSISLTAGGSSGAFYFSDPSAGSIVITASALGLTPSTPPQVLTPAPSKLLATTAPQTVGAGRCSGAINFQARDADGVTTPVLSSTQVTFTSDSPSLNFHSNSTCTALSSMATIGPGGTTATVYFLDPAAGNPSLTASAPGLVAATQRAIVKQPASQLAITTAAQALPAGRCSGAVTLQTRDADAVTTPVLGATPVSLSSTAGTTTFFGTNACATPITSLNIGPGASNTTFYFVDSAAGTPALTASSPGLTPATQGQTVIGGPSVLVFSSAAPVAIAGRCSGPITVQSRGASGLASTVVTTTALSLSSDDPGLTFHSNSTCTSAVTSMNLVAGASNANFYVLATAPGTPLLTAAATGFTAASVKATILPPPSHLAPLSAPTTLTAGRCSPVVNVQSRDLGGGVVTVAAATVVSLASSSATTTFFANAACTTPVTSVTLGAGASSVGFYFLDPTAGTANLTASSPGLGAAVHPVTLTPAPSRLSFSSGVQTVTAGRCSAAVTAQLSDANGVLATALATTSLSLSSSSPTTAFFSNPTCTAAITSLSLAMNVGSGSFYFLDPTSGAPALTVSGTGLTPGTQTQLVTPGPTALAFASNPQPVGTGTCSGTLVFQTRDGLGRAAAVLANTTVTLTSSSPSLTFYSNSNCTTAASSITVFSGASVGAAWFRDPTVGSPSITAAAAGLGNVVQAQQLVAPGTHLAFSTLPQSLANGGCSAATNVVSRNSTGALLPVGANTQVDLTSSGSTVFHSNASCTAPITSVTMTSGASSVGFFFKDSGAGAPELVASAAGYADARQTAIINLPASQLLLPGPRQLLNAGACSAAVTISARDASGVIAPLPVSTLLSLASNTAATFYSNSACTAATTGVSIAAGTSSTIFYFKDPAGGLPVISVTGPGLTPGAQTHTILSAPSQLLVTTAPQAAPAGACSGGVTVATRDPQGVSAPAPAAIPVGLSSDSPTLTFYSSATCATAVTAVTIGANSSSATLYFRDTSGGTPVLTATATGLTPASQSQRVLPPPARLDFSSAPQSVIAGRCSGQLTTLVRAANGNTAPVAGATAISLSSPSSTLTFHSTSACTTPITGGTVAPGGTTFPFFVKDTTSGTPQVLAQAAGLSAASQQVTVLAPASQLAFSSAPIQVGARGCSGQLSVAVRDAEGNLTPVPASTPVTLGSSSSSLVFYSTSTCATAITGVTVAAGASSANFFFRETTAGSPVLTATASGFGSTAQTQAVLPPASQLLFTSAPVTVGAGLCSGQLTVTSHDARGNIAPVAASTLVSLGSSSSTSSYFTNSTCTTAVTAITLGPGVSSGPVFFRDPGAGSVTLEASATGMTMGSQTQTVLPGPAGLAFTSAPINVVANGCSGAVSLATRSSQGHSAPVSAATALGLSSSSATTTFYLGSTCANPAITSLNLSATTGTATVYFRDTASGLPTLSASATGLTPGAQVQTVTPAVPARLLFTTSPQQVPAGVCSGQVGVALQDTFNNLARAAAITPINLGSSSGTMGFFSDPACSLPITTSAIAAGLGSTVFYFADTAAGTPTVTLTSGTLTAATQGQTISPPASQLAFASTAQLVNAGDCSGAVTIEARDGTNAVAAVPSNVVLSLASTSSTAAFFLDSACTTPITTATIFARSSTTTWYFTDGTAGTPTLSVTAPGLLPTSQQQLIVLGPPRRLTFSSTAQALAAGECSTLTTVVTSDNVGNPANVGAATPVSLSSTSSSLRFFSDAACSAQITQFTISNGSSTGGFHFSDVTAGTPGLTVTATGLAPASQQQTITAEAPTALGLATAPQTVIAGQCSAMVTVQSRDASGNPSPMAASTPVALVASSSSARFYSDASCSTEITGVTLAAATTTGSFHFRDTLSGTLTVTASAAGLTSASQQELIGHAPAQTLVVLGLPSPRVAGVSGGFVVSARDSFGNLATDYAAQVNFTSSDPRATLPAPFTFTTADQGTRSFTATLATAGVQAVTATDDGALVGAQTGITVNPAAPDRAIASAPGAPVAACREIEVSVSVLDAFDNVVPGAHTVTVALPTTAMATIASTDLTGGAAGGLSTTGATLADGTGRVRVTDDVAEVVAVSISAPALPQPGQGTSITFVTGSLDLTRSLFTVGPMDPARLELTGQLTARVSPRDSCDQPVQLAAGTEVLVTGAAPLVVTRPVLDTAAPDFSYTASVTLSACPSSMGLLALSATVDGAPLLTSAGAPLERRVAPGCYPASSAQTLVALSGVEGLACWTLSHDPNGTVPPGLPARLTATVTPRDGASVPIGPGQQVSVREVGLELLGAPAVDNGDGSYTVELGSDHCRDGVPVSFEVNGVAIDQGLTVDFACAAVDSARSRVATVPADGRTPLDTPIAISARVRDACGLPAFDRAVSFFVSPPSLLSVREASTVTALSGHLAAKLAPLEAGVGTVTIVVDGVSLAPAPVEVMLPPTNSFALTLTAEQPQAERNAEVTFEVVITSQVAAIARSAGLGLALEGLTLVADSVRVGGVPATLRADGLFEVGPLGAAPVTVQLTATVGSEPGLPAVARAQLFPRAGELSWSNQAEVSLEISEAPLEGPPMGCGCSSGAQGTLAVLLLLAFAVGRRRARHPPSSGGQAL